MCVRDVAKQKNPLSMSFRAYEIDLVFLLQASLMGSARTILYSQSRSTRAILGCTLPRCIRPRLYVNVCRAQDVAILVASRLLGAGF